MSVAREMLEAAPRPVEFDLDDLVDAIEACATSTQACTSCADSSLAEDDVATMVDCIARCDDCADICQATERILSRPLHNDHVVVHRQLRACVRECTVCAEECERHAAHHPHCGICARACRACAKACDELLEDEAFKELEKLAGG